MALTVSETKIGDASGGLCGGSSLRIVVNRDEDEG